MNKRHCDSAVRGMISKMPDPTQWVDSSFELPGIPDMIPRISNKSDTARIILTLSGSMYTCTIGDTKVTDTSPSTAFNRAFSKFSDVVQRYEHIHNTLKEDMRG